MITYKDRTFCSSPDCKNECGRKLSDNDRAHAKHIGLPIAFAEYCKNKEQEVGVKNELTQPRIRVE